MENKHDYITAREAAKLLKVSERAIRSRCKRGSFSTCFKFGNTWAIDRAEICTEIETAGTNNIKQAQA